MYPFLVQARLVRRYCERSRPCTSFDYVRDLQASALAAAKAGLERKLRDKAALVDAQRAHIARLEAEHASQSARLEAQDARLEAERAAVLQHAGWTEAGLAAAQRAHVESAD